MWNNQRDYQVVAKSENDRRPPVDDITTQIAEYVSGFEVDSAAALDAAHLCLIDTLGCAFEGLDSPECTKLLGPLVPGTIVPYGARVPGTAFELDPIKAAFDIGSMARWFDFTDTYLGAQASHPSDNIAGILALADHLSRTRQAAKRKAFSVREMLAAIVKAYEIQGVLAMENSMFNAGLDHTLLIKVATAGVATQMLGGGYEQIVSAVTNAWIDGHSLAIYRRSPHAGPRKSWSGGDAGARGLFLAMLAAHGEMGYPSALTAKTWGLYDVLFKAQAFRIPRAYGCSVVQETQFKVLVPAVFNSQTAAECAIQLHPLVKDRIGEIRSIKIFVHEMTLRMNTYRGHLSTPAARDHCVQYIVAVGLLKGSIESSDYSSEAASDQRIGELCEKTKVVEDSSYTRDYADPGKRASANAVQVFFIDGSSTPKVAIDYPIGHPQRRQEALPALRRKFETNLARVFSEKQRTRILATCLDRRNVERLPVHEFVGFFVR